MEQKTQARLAIHLPSSILHLRFSLVIAVALALAGCAPPGPKALLRGKALLEAGNHAAAVEELKRATTLLNTNALAWNYLGLAYHQAGDTTNAAQAYQQALKFNRDLVEVHYNLGCLWLEQNRIENAKSEFAAFTLRRPDDAAGWLKLGTAQLRSREWNAAEKSFGEALRLNARSAEALNGLGLVQMQRNRPREAEKFFNAALQQQPNYPPALLNLAVVSQAQLNNRQLALQKYREYLALPSRPGNWDAVNATVGALEQEINAASRGTPQPTVSLPVSNVPSAKPASNVVARVTPPPSKPEPTSNIVRPAVVPPSPPPAQIVKVTPQPEARMAQDIPATNPPARQTAVELDQPPKTEKRGFLQKINPINLFRRDSNGPPKTASSSPVPPASRPGTSDVANGVQPSTTIAGAVARYDYQSPPKPAAGDRLAAEKFFMQGLRKQSLGQLPEAMQDYRQATQTDPAYFEAYYNLALAASAARDFPEALRAGEFALAIRPGSLDARLNFAQSLKQSNYFFDAANELAVILARSPKDARAHLALGNLYAQQFHQPAKAREHYLKVLDYDPRNPQAPAIRDWLVANRK